MKGLTQRETYRFSNALYQKVGWIALFGLLALAMLFWKERTVCMDVAFQTFWLVNEGTFQVQVHRFGVVFVQWRPLLGIKLGLALKSILFLYSISFVLWQLICYYLIVRVFKNEYIGLVFILVFLAQVSGAFYWTISEYQQALGLLLVYFAFFLRYHHRPHWWFWVLSVPLIITLVFYHPLIFYMFSFLWAFFWLYYKKWTSLSYYLVFGFMLATWVVKRLYFKNWYDNAKARYLKENLERYSEHFWNMDSNAQFWEHCLDTFLFFPVLFLGLLIYYIYHKCWLKTGLLLGATVVYLFLVNVTHATGAEFFYLESFYYPMALFVLIPLVFELGQNAQMRKTVQIGIVVFVFFRLCTIAWGHQYFENRLQKIEQLVQINERSNHQKAMVHEQIIGDYSLEMNWAVPFETLLYSIIEQRPQQSSLFIYTHLHERQKKLENTKEYLLYMDKYYPYEELNTKYFNFSPAVYVELTSTDIPTQK